MNADKLIRVGVLMMALGVIVVLLGAIFPVSAQDDVPDSVPWQALPGGESDTAELHLGTFRCVKLNLTIKKMPSSLRIFAQEGQDRWSYQIATLLPENASGHWVVYVHINMLGLENSDNGEPDYTNLFKGSAMNIRDWGVHAWDAEHDAEFTVNDFALVNDCTIHTAPLNS